MRDLDTAAAITHQSVLFDEVMDALQPRPGVGFLAVDCTINGGGHSFGLLERATPDGRLIGFDADAEALERAAQRLAPFAGRYTLVNRNFRDVADVAADLNLAGRADGVLFDFGLSSAQLDLSGRGFSFRGDEPLDMRFAAHEAGSPTAADLLNGLPEAELERVFREYGEEPRARRVARVVVQRRLQAPLLRTGDLVAAVTQALGSVRGRIHPATRIFQALRIAVNDELGAIERGLAAALDILKPGGRLAAISFHSLEDRIVKWRFRAWAEADPETGRPARLRILTKKPITPAEAEMAANPRARSAKLRVAECLPALGAA